MAMQIWQCPEACSAGVWECAITSVEANTTIQAQKTAIVRMIPGWLEPDWGWSVTFFIYYLG